MQTIKVFSVSKQKRSCKNSTKKLVYQHLQHQLLEQQETFFKGVLEVLSVAQTKSCSFFTLNERNSCEIGHIALVVGLDNEQSKMTKGSFLHQPLFFGGGEEVVV